MSCKLDIGYSISIATEKSTVWKDKPIGYPSVPTPPNWDSLSYRKKREHVLEHERKHVQAYKAWHALRKGRIEVFETLQYPSKDECDQRGKLLVTENEKGYADVRKAQSLHTGW